MCTEITDNIDIPRWAVMWLLAFAIWLMCKLFTWHSVAGRNRSTGAAIQYFLGWPGMDPRPFVGMSGAHDSENATAWKPVLHVLVGIALIGLAGQIVAEHALLAGWIGMIGIVLALHFGLFDLIAITWRASGVAVEPIMQRPLSATSLADFWSRWNRGFRDLAFRLVFRPVHRRFSAPIATLCTFLFSGLVHDLVISVPAGAGYGRPTLYFLIQGAGVLFEKSAAGRRTRPSIIRAVMYVALIAPLGLLFPPSFVYRVFVPFLLTLTRCNMTLVSLTTLIRIGGVMHFGILIASALVPQVLDWRVELRKLSPLSRQLIWTHGAFIVLTIIGLGTIATANAPLLAMGGMLARCVCGFVAIFWFTRLVLQFALLDPKEYLTSLFLKLGYHGLTVVFASLSLIFGWAAVRWN